MADMRNLIIIVMLLLSSTAYAEDKEDHGLSNWKGQCMKCHGTGQNSTAGGSKFGAPDNLYKKALGKSIEEISTIIREGHEKMPSFKGKLTDKEIEELAIFIEYGSYVYKIKQRSVRIDRELDDIKRDYKDLPECENVSPRFYPRGY